MSIFKLTDKDREEIKDAAKALAKRRVNFEKARFPLNIKDFEIILNEPEALKVARQAQAYGFDISLVSLVYMQINCSTISVPEQECPLYVGMMVGFADKILASKIHHKTTNDYAKYVRCGYSFPMHNLPPDKLEKVRVWVNKVHRAVREQTLCVNVVDATLAQMMNTGHVLATWPTLAKLPRRSTKEGEALLKKFNQPPTRPRLYKVTWPTGEKYDNIDKLMAGADEVLVKAMMLEDTYILPKDSNIANIDIQKFQIKPDAPWYLRVKN